MSIERLNAEIRLASLEPRLPQGIRKHIRKLKENGRLEEAIRFKEEARKKRTPKQKLEDEKNKNLKQLIISNDPEQQATAAYKLTHILGMTGETTKSEREADLYAIHRTWPEQGDVLSQIEIPTIIEVSKLVEEASRT
ncbi:MAG TPA: hypothetical protein VLE44_01105 [Candidatus Saccharimonadales bacterium]|nr:hypothetical protein [Candidatus Saccharimonadales bacterium]